MRPDQTLTGRSSLVRLAHWSPAPVRDRPASPSTRAGTAPYVVQALHPGTLVTYTRSGTERDMAELQVSEAVGPSRA